MQLSRMQNSTRTASQQAAEMKTARMHQELPRRTEREQLLGSQGAAVQLSEDRQAEIRRRLRYGAREQRHGSLSALTVCCNAVKAFALRRALMPRACESWRSRSGSESH